MPDFPRVTTVKKPCLYATSLVYLLLASTSALAQQAITTPILATDLNFRDVAGISATNRGTGFADTTANNGVMRTGVFYRSEALTQLSNADRATLSTMNIRLVVDLRTPSEIGGSVSAMAPNAGQDRLPAGASILYANVYGTNYPPSAPTLSSAADSVAYFRSLYRGFVADQADLSGLHDALIALANAPGGVLFHCSGGKDRTGWTAVLLQTIAGVPQAIIRW
jgi:protein tyrosine/serine phosphatase